MSDELEQKSPESFNWRQYVAIINRRRLQFAIPFFVGWAVVWAVSWTLPAVYRSGTLILVEQPSVPSQYVVPNIAGNLQDRLQTMSQQILSRTRLTHIIDTLNLYPNERTRMTPDELVERMRKDIEIELVRSPDRDSVTSFNIYYSSGDPQTAQRVTRELTNLYISENLEARQQQSENTTKFLESQLEEARKGLLEQEDKLRRYKDQHLGELPGQLQSNLQILGGLQSQLQNEQDALTRAEQQSVYLHTLLDQYRAGQESARTGNGMTAGIPALDQELERLRAQLADLSSHYTDRHPDVRKLKEQIGKTERMKAQIAAELKSRAAASQSDASATAAGVDSRSPSPMVELEGQANINQLDIASRRRSIQTLQTKIQEYQGRLNQTPVREQELADLTRGYDQSKANYDSLLAKKNSSELATNLELQQKSEHFRILDPPSLPAKPYSPNRLKLCGVGLGLGVVLGGAFAAGIDLIDDRLFTEEELKKLVPVAILSDIPKVSTAEELQRHNMKHRLQWIATGIIFAVVVAGSLVSVVHG